MLRDDGFDPICVPHDEPAYEALRDAPGFVCMIVDVNLGLGTTGYDVARYARRLVPDLPVIYISGQSSPASVHANGVPGGIFLAKPFTADDLTELMRMTVGDPDD
jgi:DNA-binding NtrC family response regulator